MTPPQREAATHVDGPLLIIAGAGSGKTRVLTRRVAYLMTMGIPPGAILAITFTNKAAGEMKERVGKLMGRHIKDIGRIDQWYPTICTFHSLCVRILRHYGPRLGIPANFTIYDSSDQTKVIKDALKALEISSTNFSPGTVHATISNLKNQLTSPEDYARTAGAFYERNIARVYGKYQKMLEANNALDFDDLLMRTVNGFRQHNDVLGELQERYQYILIDEYQDTNHAQYVLAHALAMTHRNICVVGDPDQSIYAWRGADIQNILDFEKDYTDAKVVRLEQNYRSTKTILALASQLISKNTRRKEKGLWTENEEGAKAKFFICQTEEDEANTIIEEFKKLNAAGRPWSEMAIFYRMNSLSRVMEERLMAQRIPYQVARGVEFYNRKEIKDVLSYLRAIANPADEVSLQRVINTPTRGIGDESVRKMDLYAVSNGLTLWGAMEQAHLVPGLSTRAIKSTQAFVQMMNGFRTTAGQSAVQSDDIFAQAYGTVQSIMEQVVQKSGLLASLEKSTDPDKPELANVKELIN
ncbi:MAG: ATP-dependent helicase, partial [Tepidisphaeraceae bacterium]